MGLLGDGRTWRLGWGSTGGALTVMVDFPAHLPYFRNSGLVTRFWATICKGEKVQGRCGWVGRGTRRTPWQASPPLWDLPSTCRGFCRGAREEAGLLKWGAPAGWAKQWLHSGLLTDRGVGSGYSGPSLVPPQGPRAGDGWQDGAKQTGTGEPFARRPEEASPSLGRLAHHHFAQEPLSKGLGGRRGPGNCSQLPACCERVSEPPRACLPLVRSLGRKENCSGGTAEAGRCVYGCLPASPGSQIALPHPPGKQLFLPAPTLAAAQGQPPPPVHHPPLLTWPTVHSMPPRKSSSWVPMLVWPWMS